MNKKLKKALYMSGFTLPIVAIPIITVACRTQTSQNIPKEANKNQNEQTPKQETPIQDENKKVVVSSSLSSSKIYDENLLNSNVIELFKLFEERSNLENIKKTINEILKKLRDYPKTFEELDILSTNQITELDQMIKKLEMSLKSISKSKIKSINDIIEKAKAAAEKAKAAAEKAKAAADEGAKAADEGAKAADEGAKAADEGAKAAAKEAKAIAEEVKAAADAKAVAEAENTIKIIDKSFSEIGQYAIDLYKKIFLNELSFGITNFSELKYNDFLPKFSEVKLINFFNIESLKKHLENLIDDNKLNEIVLKNIFNSNVDKLIDYFKKDDTNKQINLDLINTKDNKLLYKGIQENDPTTFEKIKGDLNKDLTKPENIKSLFDKLIFSDLFDVAKLQEKLNQ